MSDTARLPYCFELFKPLHALCTNASKQPHDNNIFNALYLIHSPNLLRHDQLNQMLSRCIKIITLYQTPPADVPSDLLWYHKIIDDRHKVLAMRSLLS